LSAISRKCSAPGTLAIVIRVKTLHPGRDNGSSNAADGYGVFELRAIQRIIELILATSPRVLLAAQFPCAA
jgi:hypothetical protein